MLVHVAFRALGDPVLCRELATVCIGVTSVTLFRRSLELDLVRSGRDLVAFGAGDRAVSPGEGKFRFRMVESANINPGTRVVARFTAQSSSVGALCRHALLEFTFVNVGVAACATAILEVERQNLVQPPSEARLVAFAACDSDMRPGEHEARALVLGNREGRTMEVFYGMAVLAAILMRSSRKLLVMRVPVAIRAGRKVHFVHGIFARRGVAFFTGHGGVFAFQRVLRSCVLFHAEQ